MKTLFSVIAAAAVFGFAAPSNAKADCPGETRIVGYTSFGAPIISVYQVVGYDAYGRPIGQWVTQGVQYGCQPPRPVIVQPSINFGVGLGVNGCRPNYGYGYGHHHHHGFHR
ncbi:hypothetical protein [Prosthecobacter fluviatilis]|uniref:Uncharacterized protein n=1 Tax=Prosthecobacter fluviatilis TaxID=445931 RepID=A0ABW0KYX6_9BACT